MIENADIERRFQLHKPDEARGRAMDHVRSSIIELAYTIVANTYEGREQSLALTKLEEVTFFAIASIARKDDEAQK